MSYENLSSCTFDIINSSQSLPKTFKMTLEEELMPLISSRGGHKGKITRIVTEEDNPSTLSNFATSVTNITEGIFCRFCNVSGHSNNACIQFKTLEARKERLSFLRRCWRCTNGNHVAKQCPGSTASLKYACKVCNSKGHITALCYNDPSLKDSLLIEEDNSST